MFARIAQLAERLGAYPLWQVLIEVGIIWIVVYVVVRFVQGTRAVGALRGVLLLLVIATVMVRVLGGTEAFQRLRYLYDNFLTLLAITLIVVFQPELRRGLIRLGEAQVFRRVPTQIEATASAIVDACAFLSKAKFGALIVIEREIGLKGLIEGGTTVGAEVSARLLQTIFFPGSALHDLAVVIKADRIESAGVQLPLAEPEEMPDASLGSRHRAAVGLSKECDALVVVVSEETGMLSIAERGRLDRGFTPAALKDEIIARVRGGHGIDVQQELSAIGHSIDRLRGKNGAKDGAAKELLKSRAEGVAAGEKGA
ncbi:MAG: diadenylate cyclase CdaA [Phycisphaeraceae bacterium]|nr:diadenylate cyclase CdaA [Phycisphaeraceae bacterium]